MNEKKERKDRSTAVEKAPYEKPQLHNYGKLENMVYAENHKIPGGVDSFSSIGQGIIHRP